MPNLTGFAMSLGFVVSGAILIEYVFNYPHVGYMLLQAVENEDFALEMRGLFLLLITLAAAANHPDSRHRDRDLRGSAHQDGGLNAAWPSSA